MPYLERLREARYRSPGGVEFAFEFRDLQRAGSKKAPIHEFPQQDLPEVQDLGQAAVHFAIEATFSGVNYDLTADAFWTALGERGPATLLHPRWGDITVLPISFAQKESFVDDMRRAVFTVEFVRTVDTRFPVTAVQTESSIAAGLDAFEAKASTAVGGQILPIDAADAAIVKADLRSSLDKFKDRIVGTIAEAGEISADFKRKVNDFENKLDTLILNPINLAASVLELIRTPGRAVVSIVAKVKGYCAAITTLKDIAVDTVMSIAQTATASKTLQFLGASKTLQFLGLLSGISESCLSGDLTNRAEAVQVAEIVQESFAVVKEIVEAIETILAQIQVIDYTTFAQIQVIDYTTLAQIQAINSQTAALMLERSFSLKIERRLTLESERTPLDLCYELYGEIDSLDAFIEHNALQGDELLLIPRGREVVYYVG